NLVEELRLTDENDLHQLLLVGLEIGQHSNLFEELGREMLRFVENRDAALAEHELREQKLIQPVEELFSRRILDTGDSKLAEQRGEHLMGVEKRIEDQRRVDAVLVELLDQVATEGRLARSRFAGDEHEAFAIADSIQELTLCLAVLSRVEDELRVRGERERLVLETEEALVHEVV